MIRRILTAVTARAALALGDLAGWLGGPPRWCIHITDDGTHTYPLADSIEHRPDNECVCGPTARLTTCEDHGDDWTYQHHPLTQADRLEDYT